MSRPISIGYLRPSTTRLTTGPWTVAGPTGTDLESPEILEDWDQATEVRVRLRLEIDLAGVLEDCELGDGAVLSLILLWHSSATGLRGGSEKRPAEDGTNDVEIRLAGELLGGALNLEVRLILDYAPERGPVSPGRPGSTLWSDSYRLALEGSGMRFPTSRVSFGTNGIAGGRDDGHDGIWALQFDSDDLTASASGSVRLLLNSDHPAVPEMLDRPDSPVGRALQEFLRYDLARQFLVTALRNEELREIDYDEGSVGELLRSIVDRYFDRSLDQLRRDLNSDPGALEAELQARMGILRP